MLLSIIAVSCHTEQTLPHPQVAQPEGLVSGLGRAATTYLLDLGAHVTHLILNGLPLEQTVRVWQAGEDLCKRRCLVQETRLHLLL